MTYDELFNRLTENEVKEITTATWKPFRRTYAVKENGQLYFLRRKHKASRYLWNCAYDKQYRFV